MQAAAAAAEAEARKITTAATVAVAVKSGPLPLDLLRGATACCLRGTLHAYNVFEFVS